MLPFPSSVSVISVSEWLSLREDMEFISQKMSERICFLLSSIVATSCGLSVSVFVLKIFYRGYC